jgi:hypothetical protein
MKEILMNHAKCITEVLLILLKWAVYVALGATVVYGYYLIVFDLIELGGK